MKRTVTAALAAASAALIFTGCSSSEIINTGGDTKCGDFLTQDEQKQNDNIVEMLKDQNGGNEPANLEITAKKFSVSTYCQVAGNQDTKISAAP